MAAPWHSRIQLERLALSIVLTALVAVLVQTDWLRRLDQLFYDTQLKFWQRPAPDDIVIVAIDDASLTTLGRWPWNRRNHAELLRRLTEAGARAVALDIIFAERDVTDAQADAELIDAIAANRNVALPIIVEQTSTGGQLIEILPFPEMAQAAAALGHVHVELDPDGIARRIFLKEGLGHAFWPNLAVALLRLVEPDRWQQLPGARAGNTGSNLPFVVQRDHQMLIAFAGPPGHFQHISYQQVLKGEFVPDAFRGKIALVGATATGIGDTLPTPVSGLLQPMSGVELNANVIDALRRGIVLTELGRHWTLVVSIGLALLPVLLFPHLSPRGVVLSTGVLILLTISISAGLLRLLHTWFPPVPALVALTLSYPLWSWRRLETTVRYLNQELEALKSEQTASAVAAQAVEITDCLNFARQVLPLHGWAMLDEKGQTLAQWGAAPPAPAETPHSGRWLRSGAVLWTTAHVGNRRFLVGLQRQRSDLPSRAEQALLDQYVQLFSQPVDVSPRSTTEIVESRIRQVQTAATQLRSIRRFISDTLSQMSDGVVVADLGGRVTLANTHAARYLTGNDELNLAGRQLNGLLEALEAASEVDWARTYRHVVLRRATQTVEAKSAAHADLLIQVAPLELEDAPLAGLIVNIADISAVKDSERKRNEALNFLSHDLRSPMVSLLALVELSRLKRDGLDIGELLDKVETYARRNLDLADDFLHLAKAEAMEPEGFADMDLAATTQAALEQVFPQAQAKDIRISARIPTGEITLQGNRALLERALVNLLNNAIKYSEPEALIEVTLTAHDGVAQCCVSDTGMGIPAAELPLIFDRFHRVAGRPKTKGLGLGLPFVKTVVEKHRGKIAVDSTPGEGSRFCVSLPCSACSEQAG